jgi:hypothetical protein
MPAYKKVSAQAEPEIKVEFNWDEENIRHLTRHEISPAEAEEVIGNRPRDLESELRNGEERVV